MTALLFKTLRLERKGVISTTILSTYELVLDRKLTDDLTVSSFSTRKIYFLRLLYELGPQPNDTKLLARNEN